MASPILLIGATGQVGHALRQTPTPLGRVVAPGRAELDLAAPDRLSAAIRASAPSIVVNAAAYTAVDCAKSEPERAALINATAPGRLAAVTRDLEALLVHCATDYIFDGTKGPPYTEDDRPAPLNVYGRTKWAGEEAIRAAGGRHLILRTSWVYSGRRTNFLRTMLRLGAERDRVQGVSDQTGSDQTGSDQTGSDQTGSPTWAGWIAAATATLLARERALRPQETYHLSSRGATTWYEFARALFDLFDVDAPVVEPISTAAYGAPAPRPAYSVLSTERIESAVGLAVPRWQEQLHAAHRAMADA